MIISEKVSEKLQYLLGQVETWKNLVSSQFVKHIAIFVGWAVEDADFKVERAHQEGFLDSALNRSSILAHGEGKEYTPQKPIPATGKAIITNVSEVRFSLPTGMEFQSDEQITYTLMEAVTLEPASKVYTEEEKVELISIWDNSHHGEKKRIMDLWDANHNTAEDIAERERLMIKWAALPENVEEQRRIDAIEDKEERERQQKIFDTRKREEGLAEYYEEALADFNEERRTYIEGTVIEVEGEEQVIGGLDHPSTAMARFDQMSKVVGETITCGEEKAFYEILFSRDETPKIHDYIVEVSEDGTGDADSWETWEYDRLLINAYADDKVYDEFYHFTDQLGIRFGNGDFGKKLPYGALVRITKVLTEGETMLLKGSSLWFTQDVFDDETGLISVVSDVTVQVYETIQYGEAQEETEKTRRMLHYHPVYNNRLIWENDYKYFLSRRFPDIVFVVAWGEEESTKMWGYQLEFVNQICICAYSPERTPENMKEVAMSAIKEVSFLCRNFKWFDVVHLSFGVRIEGKVHQDATMSKVVEDIKTTLNNSYGKASRNRREEVLIHEVYNDIQDTGYFDRTTGAWFTVELSGNYTAQYLYEMVSIDFSLCSFDIEYIN